MITATSAGPAYLTRFSDGLHEGLADTTPDKGGAGAGFRRRGAGPGASYPRLIRDTLQ